MRNHNTVTRPDVINAIAALVPQDKGHTVSLEGADVFVLVEIFKVASIFRSMLSGGC